MSTPAPQADSLGRELGLWTALAIGSGTMMGAGIFLLSGVAIARAGPAAVFSYLLAGAVCVVTAASAAELATGMPTSGGDYYFVSRSLGPAFGAISGVGIWLSLSFAIAFYLFGTGEYLAEFLPLDPFWGALVGGIVLLVVNVLGAKESGGIQVVVVLTLTAILAVFVVFGVTELEPSRLRPFFPYGRGPVLSTTALVFISFLGFVKIAAVSEEIKDPARNLPRALIGSVCLVSVLYVLIVLVVAGIVPESAIGEHGSVLSYAAGEVFGSWGIAAMVFAGLLATLSSANASIMAASRINLAMARDRMVPNWLSRIHPARRTPYRAILVTGALALSLLFIESLETLAEIASVLQLYSYAALNIGCVLLRVASPEWYRPSYRVPASPFLNVLAALGCVGIVLVSGAVAQAVILVLILASLSWYFVWGLSRVSIKHGLPEFKDQWLDWGPRAFFLPLAEPIPTEGKPSMPALRAVDASEPRRVAVAVANPATMRNLLRLGRLLATGLDDKGIVYGVHLRRMPLGTPLSVAREQFGDWPPLDRAIRSLASPSESLLPGHRPLGDARRPYEETEVVPVVDVAHDVFDTLIAEVSAQQADMLLIGWEQDFSISRIYNNPVQRVISRAPADVAVLKDRGLEEISSILVPWGGGMHALLGLEIALRMASATGAAVNLLRVVRPGTDTEREKQELEAATRSLIHESLDINYVVREDDNVLDGLRACVAAADCDLVVIGASQEWRIRNVLFGSIPDVIADSAPCSVVMVRRLLPDHWSLRTASRLKRLREAAGLTTSPEEGDEP